MQYSCYLSVGINSSVNTNMAVGILSQWWIRTRYPRWFTKYKCVSILLCSPEFVLIAVARHSYILAAGMDGGTQVVTFMFNFVRAGSLSFVFLEKLTVTSRIRLFSVLPGQRTNSRNGGATISTCRQIAAHQPLKVPGIDVHV